MWFDSVAYIFMTTLNVTFPLNIELLCKQRDSVGRPRQGVISVSLVRTVQWECLEKNECAAVMKMELRKVK